MHQRNVSVIKGGEDDFSVGVGHNLFERIVSLKNLLLAWREFRRGKRNKPDVQQFEFSLEDNLFKIHQELLIGAYKNDPYVSFYVTDPKLRHIHKASVRDRVIHQAVFRVLYPIFDASFIFDSYSCRLDKGTHRAVVRLEIFLRKMSRNFQQSVWALKLDIRKFFDAVDHDILLGLIRKKISDQKILCLIEGIVRSFTVGTGRGLPLGNVTSQLFSNIYLNALDQFVKHQLLVKYYLRYCDDYVIVADRREYLERLIPRFAEFLGQALKLELHKKKIIIRKYSQGVDFLGYVILPYYIVLRTKTKRRMLKRLLINRALLNNEKVNQVNFNQSVQSYFGVLSHCRGYKLIRLIKSVFSFLYL
ncbi:MAG: reverse transcriptase domain-containing protein [Patescibacteria group bacterium]